MFVCLCRVVTDHQVRDAIHRGARNIDEVGESCGAGTGCGACHEQIQEMIDGEAATCARSCAQRRVAIAAVVNSR